MVSRKAVTRRSGSWLEVCLVDKEGVVPEVEEGDGAEDEEEKRRALSQMILFKWRFKQSIHFITFLNTCMHFIYLQLISMLIVYVKAFIVGFI